MGNELFKNIPSKVGDLVKDVRNGRIGLPDLQRPFVWKDNKVRELFDSMLKGYPIGYIMLWESPADYESKKSTIGDNSKTYEDPKELVIDGQQRLTALVAAMFAVKVKDKNFADREIKISYNPLTREFAVWSQAYEKDTEWISRISDVFLAKEDNSISSLRRHFIKEANEGRSKKGFPLLTDEEEDRIEDSINALLNLSDYSLPTLEISYNADEEDVADIFVRVNSGGQSLTENNFIQTLISVYENETSDKINAFAAASRVPAANTSYNTLLAIEPSHLIRMAVGFGFKRARLKYAYMLGTLERRIAKQAQLVDNLKKYKRGVVRTLLTPDSCCIADATWTTAKIGDLGSFTKGAPLSKADIAPDGTPFILYGELYTTYHEVINAVIRRTQAQPEKQYYSRVGDVIIPTSGETPEEISTAACVMLPDIILAGDLNIFRSSKIDGRIMSYILNHIVNGQIARIAQGKSVVHIQASELSKIEISYPDYNTQRKMFKIFDALNTRTEIAQKKLMALRCMQKALLQQLFM